MELEFCGLKPMRGSVTWEGTTSPLQSIFINAMGPFAQTISSYTIFTYANRLKANYPISYEQPVLGCLCDLSVPTAVYFVGLYGLILGAAALYPKIMGSDGYHIAQALKAMRQVAKT
jgi:hypothetical protein